MCSSKRNILLDFFCVTLPLLQMVRGNSIKSIAPGRVCLFGDHQDYLGLPVIACAINRYLELSAIRNDKNRFEINLCDLGEKRILSIDDELESLNPRDYFASGLRVIKRFGCMPDVGYDVTITGNIPINAGVSSSSAMVIAWVNFLLEAFGTDKVDPEVVARLGFEAEVKEHGEPGGIMDHYSIALGDVVLINTGAVSSYHTIANELKGLIISESGIPKETIGLLAKLKKNARKAVDLVKKRAENFKLDDALPDDVHLYSKFLPENLRPYLDAALRNHFCTNQALKEFKKASPNLENIGRLMNEHHSVLKDILKITVPKIDRMIDAALGAGALGAKILGSGGGGSIVVIAPDKQPEVIKALKDVGVKAAYEVKVDSGARILNSAIK